ncbi:hypothetical protein SK128_011873 [Halocaridina rubra]|uniref:Sulfotransferase n=1 Tax=Halocaridina rubra TaxID=373956 RepID=A0AAN8WIA6_HALRR
MILTSNEGNNRDIGSSIRTDQLKDLMLEGNESTKSHQDKPLFILLISSIGRSGSTVVSEILGTREKSVLFFEPLWDKKKDPCFIKTGECVPDFLKKLAHCEFEQEFEEWLRWKGLFLQFYHPQAARCFSLPSEGSGRCRRELKLRSLCEQSSVRMAKMIRSRLIWLESLLNDESFNVKIIHLTRDPRGSLLSYRKLGWDASSSKQCSRLYTDMKDFEKLAKFYPTKLFHLQLEALSTAPYKTLGHLFGFLYGNSTLPKRVKDFVERHMNSLRPSYGNMDTIKNSKIEFDAWRWKISVKILRVIEKEESCRSAIGQLNHVIFGSLENATNRSLPLEKPSK